MFSEALRILDRNMAELMVDRMKDEIVDLKEQNCWKNRDSIYIENRLNMIQKEPCDDIKSHGSFNQCRRWDLNPHAVTRTRI